MRHPRSRPSMACSRSRAVVTRPGAPQTGSFRSGTRTSSSSQYSTRAKRREVLSVAGSGVAQPEPDARSAGAYALTTSLPRRVASSYGSKKAHERNPPVSVSSGAPPASAKLRPAPDCRSSSSGAIRLRFREPRRAPQQPSRESRSRATSLACLHGSARTSCPSTRNPATRASRESCSKAREAR